MSKKFVVKKEKTRGRISRRESSGYASSLERMPTAVWGVGALTIARATIAKGGGLVGRLLSMTVRVMMSTRKRLELGAIRRSWEVEGHQTRAS